MESGSHYPPSQLQEGGEETLKHHGEADQEIPLDPVQRNPPQHSGMSAPPSPSSTSPFPPPPVSIDYPPPPITQAHVSHHPQPHPQLTSPSVAIPLEGLFCSKRKKGTPNLKKQKSIIRRYETLIDELNPIPFSPVKIIHFAKHEGLLRTLGLWDFVHTQFDSSVNINLIAQLVASYDSKARCSYVNGVRIGVNRADFARAFKLPVRKGESNVGGVGLDRLSLEEEKVFMEEFMSNWVLLHGDIWMMPREILNWAKMIKGGIMEKVDWPGMFWVMIEKELAQGEKLRDCYYASHLQHLIKSQHEAFLSKDDTEKLEFEVEVRGEEECDGSKDDVKLGEMSMVQDEAGVPVNVPNIKLTLGQDGGDAGGGGKVRDAEMMDVDKGNVYERREEHDPEENEHEEHEEREEREEQGLLDVENIDDCLEKCNIDQSEELDNNEVNIYEGEESEDEEEGDRSGDGLDDVPNHDSFEGDGLTGNFHQPMEMNSPHAAIEDIQRKDGEILRLEKELFVMCNLVESYKSAYKRVEKEFAEYRRRFPLPEEPIYRDVGLEGLMLSAAEIERQRLKVGQQAVESREGEEEVRDNPDLKQQVTESRAEQFAESPECKEQFTESPERKEQVTESPEHKEQVDQPVKETPKL